MTFKKYDIVKPILITPHYPAGDPRLKKAWIPKAGKQKGTVSRVHSITIIQK